MLVLTRKLGEKIVIGDEIKVTILGIKGKQIQLGVEAPSHVPIHRQEVFERIQEQNVRAVVSQGAVLGDIAKVLRSRYRSHRGRS